MAAWKGERKESWASNPNIAVYIFAALFIVWFGFQVWSRLPSGPPPPTGLDPMVMAALGVAVTSKSVESRTSAKELKNKVDALEEVATKAHPEEVEKHNPPLRGGEE